MQFMNSPNPRILIDTGVSTEISAPFGQANLLILRGIHKLRRHESVHAVYEFPQSLRFIDTEVSIEISAPFGQVNLLILRGIH